MDQLEAPSPEDGSDSSNTIDLGGNSTRLAQRFIPIIIVIRGHLRVRHVSDAWPRAGTKRVALPG